MVAELVNIEVVYALPEKQVLLALKVASGSGIEQALQQSGVLRRFPELDLATMKVGIYSRIVPLTTALAGGERIRNLSPVDRRSTGDAPQAGRKRLKMKAVPIRSPAGL